MTSTPTPALAGGTPATDSASASVTSAAITQLPAPSPSAPTVPLSVSITEIMFVPQPPYGDSELESWNEYVEIQNYGDDPIDVAGWFISDGGVLGNPDELIAWDERLPGIPVGDATTDSTIIPPGGFALILPRAYEEGKRPYDHQVTPNTIILTNSDDPDTDSELLGKDGLSATGNLIDVLVLYLGSRDEIEEVVSTYGTPVWDEDASPSSIRDNQLDRIPFPITWGGYRRLAAGGTDSSSNWRRFTWDQKTPGY